MSQKISNADGRQSNMIDCLNISEKKVGLFVTCLVNTMRPSVGFASITLLEQAGCTVKVPERQSCCGQPAFNSGDDEGTRQIAYQTIKQFENFDYVSCNPIYTPEIESIMLAGKVFNKVKKTGDQK